MKRTLAALLVCAMAMGTLPALALEPQEQPTAPQPSVETQPSTPEDGSLLGKPTVPDDSEDGSLFGKPTVPDGPEDGSLLGKPTVPGAPEEEGEGEAQPEGATAVLTKNHVLYLAGFPDRRFQPDQTLTRAQGAQIVCWRPPTRGPSPVPTPMCPTASGTPSRCVPCVPWASLTTGPVSVLTM